MTKLPDEDSIAEKLDHTRWDYSQGDDRRFLLEPVGKFFSTFRWDPAQENPVVVKRIGDDDTQA